MTDNARTNILPSDIDYQGNVVLWDHGPQEPRKFHGDTEEQARGRREAYEAERKSWEDRHGDLAQPRVMHASDAGHAMTVEPGRYALEPDDLDEGEIDRRVKEMQEKRRAAALAAETVADRKSVITEIMSERKAEAMAADAERADAEPRAEPRAEIQSDQAEPHDEHKPIGPRPMQPGDDLNV